MKQELLPPSLEFSAKDEPKDEHFFFGFLILLTLIFYCPCSLFYQSLHNALPQHVYDMFLAITSCPPMLMAGHYILGGEN